MQDYKTNLRKSTPTKSHRLLRNSHIANNWPNYLFGKLGDNGENAVLGNAIKRNIKTNTDNVFDGDASVDLTKLNRVMHTAILRKSNARYWLKSNHNAQSEKLTI